MNKTGKALLTFAAIAATVSLGANALLWNRYTPERQVLRFGDGTGISRGAYQTALESADASGDTLNDLLLSNTYDPMMRRAGELEGEAGGAFEPVANTTNRGTSLLGKALRVADADVPVVRRRRVARPVRRRIVRSCTPTRSTVRSVAVRRTPVAKVAGVVVRPTGTPVSAMDTSTVRGRLRPALQPLASTNGIGGGVGNSIPLSFAGPGAVEPTGVVASYPVNAPGATVFSQVGPGAAGSTIGGGAAGTTLGAISPVALGATALLGAVVANNVIDNSSGSGTTGGGATTGGTTGGVTTGGATTAGTTTGGTTTGVTTGGATTSGTSGTTTGGNDPDVPAVPEPAPIALGVTTLLGVAGLMVRARRKTTDEALV